jgi:indolepyruvate ferredoxin oxidoreductase alpha subunit
LGFGQPQTEVPQAESKQAQANEPPQLPIRPPVLCAGCPHRASFFAVKEAVREAAKEYIPAGLKAVFTGDIGCYTLGNAQPLDMVDTCLCMGGGITVAQGLKRAEPDTVHFAFIGDSTFFHSGITGLINAVYNQTDIIVVILDNSTTAMTGNQPHPGMGVTMMGGKPEKVSIERIVTALDISGFEKVDPLDQKAAKEAVKAALAKKGVRVIIFESPCIAIVKSDTKAIIDTAVCTGCKLCVKKLGCPALCMEQGKAAIDTALCTGCGLCVYVCAANAISTSRTDVEKPNQREGGSTKAEPERGGQYKAEPERGRQNKAESKRGGSTKAEPKRGGQ